LSHYDCKALHDTSSHFSMGMLLQDLLTKHVNVVSEFLTAHYDEVCFILDIFIWFEHILAAPCSAREKNCVFIWYLCPGGKISKNKINPLTVLHDILTCLYPRIWIYIWVYIANWTLSPILHFNFPNRTLCSQFFDLYERLLTSPNYVTRRQSLKVCSCNTF